MASKSFVVDGVRYRKNALIPYGQIEHFVGGLSVTRPDYEVAEMVRGMALQSAGKDKRWTESRIEHAVRYSLYCHRRNVALYHHVMG